MAATDTAKSIVAAIVFAVSLLVLYLSLHGLGPRIDAAPHVALGEVLAREALKLCGQGGRIFAIARDTSAFVHAFGPTGEVYAGSLLIAGSTCSTGVAVNRSDDGGLTWRGASLTGLVVKALAVSACLPGLVYAGTKPPRLFRSADGGRSWRECEAFAQMRRWWWWHGTCGGRVCAGTASCWR